MFVKKRKRGLCLWRSVCEVFVKFVKFEKVFVKKRKSEVKVCEARKKFNLWIIPSWNELMKYITSYLIIEKFLIISSIQNFMWPIIRNKGDWANVVTISSWNSQDLSGSDLILNNTIQCLKFQPLFSIFPVWTLPGIKRNRPVEPVGIFLPEGSDVIGRKQGVQPCIPTNIIKYCAFLGFFLECPYFYELKSLSSNTKFYARPNKILSIFLPLQLLAFVFQKIFRF